MILATTTTSVSARVLQDRPGFRAMYLIGLIVFTLICSYVLLFSGSVALEGTINGWYLAAAHPEDNYAYWWSCLTAFPCLLGVIGGIGVLTTQAVKYHNIKMLLFTPAAVWTTQLVLINFKWGLTYWTQWLYLVPLMLLSHFMLYGVIKQVRVPVINERRRHVMEDVTD